ncbi:MAG: LPS export ABC transporter periplasmic protein LptC [Euryarchaeota archaeon]|nr:LPS export ABC transporter periplasmic protein LptC [Euryarchaeota archaeon]|tara:strand:- start:1971 stop:2519 length:549 start_codon:yes stop_codon:yes gene_type:complete
MNRITSTFSVFIALFGFYSCGVVEAEKVQVVDLEEKALQVITGGSFRYSEKSQIKNVLEAGRLERWESDGSSSEVWRVSNGFTLYIDGDKENHDAVLSGGRGTYEADLGHLIAYDDVELINSEGEKLNTEYLVWSNDSDIVRTNRPVRIESKTGTLEGNGLEADSKFENYRILNPTGAFELP